MKTIIILQGISGSGKSTWASKQKEVFALLGCEIVSAERMVGFHPGCNNS